MHTVMKIQCDTFTAVVAERDALRSQVADLRINRGMARLLADLYKEQRDDARQELTKVRADLAEYKRIAGNFAALARAKPTEVDYHAKKQRDGFSDDQR